LESGDFGHVVSFGTFFNGNVAAGHAEFPSTTFAGVTGEIRNAFQAGMDADPAIPSLTVAEVQTIITNAVQQALVTRAAIREPIGVPARVHVAVVDTQGNILGTFRMQDGTNFSYDVAVQKARTANFFSSNTAAFSTRSVGFLAQRFFPPGINRTGPGPLYHLQNELSGLPSLSPTLSQIQLPQKYLSSMKIRNGITIFPGGFPLYKNGVLVGAIGISGDGVDQDDLIGYAGTNGFRPSPDIRIDHLGDDAIKSQILDTLPELQALGVQSDVINFITTRSNAGFLHVRMPYVKFPRNPNV
jgi:uncharacterized protein GlcG (DUF336 family)